ncbi:hypothetical protein [Pontibacter roseus]|uniref:hypothetical protein n=1 Tax=Pontibacter roseus TaxID=336989 RepID=UPI0003745A6A|nr:hypothetical protein [Pontibacter roseus]
MVISETCFASITYSRKPEALFIKWKTKPDTQQFVDVYWQVLQFVKNNPRICFYCTDISQSGPFDSEQEAWLNAEYYPKVFDCIQSDIYAAVVFSEGHFKALVSNYVATQLLPLHEFIHFNYFTNPDEAWDWIAYMQESQDFALSATS